MTTQGTRKKSKPHPEDWPYANVLKVSDADRVTLRTFGVEIANDYLLAYPLRRNGVHFWRAWLALRKTGTPPNERMLLQIDRYAERLCKAKGQREIALAIDMTRDEGRGRGFIDADAEFAGRSLIVEIWMAASRAADDKPRKGKRPTVTNELMKALADKHKLTPGALKTRWSRWWRDSTTAERKSVFEQLTEALRPTR